MTLNRSIIWIDAGSRTTQTIPRTLTGAASLQTALQNHSNATAAEFWEGTSVFTPPAAVSALFPDVRDLARLTFTTPAGDLVTVSLPAPMLSIFKPDTVTVDPSAIADIITAAVGNLCTTGGVAVTSFVAGVRNQRASNS